MARPIDLLIRPRWLIPVVPHGVTLENHALAVHRGNIVAIEPADEALEQYDPREIVDLPEHILIPGLVNAHTHAAMSLLRGVADDLPLMTWLTEHIWPAEGRLLSPEFVRDGTLLACAEMLRGGVTCFNDMYFYPQAAAEAAMQLGMRASLGIVTLEFPTRYAADADDYLDKGLAARDSYFGEDLLSFTLSPHAPYTVGDTAFQRILTLSEQLDLPIHTHLHETASEISDSLKQYGVRPLTRLHRLGLLSPNLTAVHAVHLDDHDLDLLALHGCHIAHCPTSNLKLASGIAPLTAMLEHHIPVAIGTDGCASNNRLDLLAETRLAALLAKGSSGQADAVDAHTALRLATLEGARALGLEQRIGSLEAGKAADLCAIRLHDLETLPCYQPASHLIHVCGREHVSDVWVSGQRCVNTNKLGNSVVNELMVNAQVWQNKIRD